MVAVHDSPHYRPAARRSTVPSRAAVAGLVVIFRCSATSYSGHRRGLETGIPLPRRRGAHHAGDGVAVRSMASTESTALVRRLTLSPNPPAESRLPRRGIVPRPHYR